MEEGHQEKLGFCLGFSKEVAEDGRQGLRARNRASEPEVRVERRPNLPPTPLHGGSKGKGLQGGCGLGAFHWHRVPVCSRRCLEAGWGLGNTRDVQDRHQSRALLCRCLGRRLGHSMQNAPRFPPRPFGDERAVAWSYPGLLSSAWMASNPGGPENAVAGELPARGKTGTGTTTHEAVLPLSKLGGASGPRRTQTLLSHACAAKPVPTISRTRAELRPRRPARQLAKRRAPWDLAAFSKGSS